ncbi:hypothetical protein OCK74_27110 [Chitinophagaceae bacterium LB-8]|uniref:Uncharacterized protein n=1 Tax=Paraflavisolibacter caeni TaxID=2982496 RepID=A0A9X3BKE2_9BACT|nr:hypothetical protein [Paraflavisolibacter caeni]MCU7552818.1 hypothetical protein [Paraflavisolibacter caeni]
MKTKESSIRGTPWWIKPAGFSLCKGKNYYRGTQKLVNSSCLDSFRSAWG